MGKKKTDIRNRSKTLPSSPTHSLSSSSSSSDFEFRISVSPRKSSAALCPADELFYKGQLLPLHLSPRISMVRNLLLASSSTSSSSDTTTTASRDSSSSNDSTSSSFATDLSLLTVGDPCCDSSRPSSVADDDRVVSNYQPKRLSLFSSSKSSSASASCKYFSLSRFSNVFKKDHPPGATNNNTNTNINANSSSCSSSSSKSDGSSVKKVSSSAKEVIRKYLKKVKPLYEKLSSSNSKQEKRSEGMVEETTVVLLSDNAEEKRGVLARSGCSGGGGGVALTTSLSGNLKCPKMIRRSCVASCPSSMRSSPSHSGVLTRTGMPVRAGLASHGSGSYSSETSTMEELQSAIQGAIAHCKNSMLQPSTSSFNHNNTKGKAIDV